MGSVPGSPPRTPGRHDGTMPRSIAAPGRTGRPPLTSRAQILAAARELIDRDGWEKLTVRKLAAEIGVGATTLYHHIRNKNDLLVLLLNQYIGQIERHRPPVDPRDRIIAATLTAHDALAAWPWVAEALSTDGFVALLDESALWVLDDMLSGAQEYGCTPDQSVYVMRSLWYYTVGESIVRARSARRQATGEPIVFLGSFDAEKVPHLADIGLRWAVLTPRDTYPHGLSAMVDGLLAQCTGRARAR
jgi:AcrR family transcriptional regulator